MFIRKVSFQRSFFCHPSSPLLVMSVLPFLSSQCVTLGSNFLCKITIFIYLQIDTI
ncbi:MAG: hypothetical protein ACR5K5_04760 [Wolbachia sp.]